MSELAMNSLSGDTFAIDASFDDSKLKLAFRGNGDMDATEPLNQYLERAFDEMQRLAASRVIFDFRELEFMNSSCFKAFVTFIARSKEADGAPILFVTDPAHHWQRRSLEALRRLAMGLVTIEQV